MNNDGEKRNNEKEEEEEQTNNENENFIFLKLPPTGFAGSTGIIAHDFASIMAKSGLASTHNPILISSLGL